MSAVLVLDTASGQMAGQIPVGASPHQAPLTRDGRWALVPSQGPGELGIIDTASGAVAGVVAVGKTPHWVSPSSDGTMAYVANEGSNDVSVVDLNGRRVVATVAVGNAPRKIAVQPGSIRKAEAPTPGRTVTIGDVAFADHGIVDVRSASDIVIHAEDYYFEPTFLRARASQRLRLSVLNRAGTLHNLTIPALGIDRDVPPSARVDVDLNVPAAGSLLFFCKFHGPLGQNGRVLIGDIQ